MLITSCTVIKAKRWPHGEKHIVLSFDDGPSTNTSMQLLDVLKKHQVKVTFFYIGRNVEKSPDAVKRAWQEGHEMAIHSYDRNFPPFFSTSNLLSDIQRTQSALEQAVGESVAVRLYRPPRGLITPPVRKLLASETYQLGYINFYGWDADANSTNYHEVINSLKEKILRNRGAAIVLHESRYKKNLMQDDSADKQWLPAAVDEFIVWALKNGYNFSHFPSNTSSQLNLNKTASHPAKP